jgi:GNAT superfamily N-acetyltransferase
VPGPCSIRCLRSLGDEEIRGLCDVLIDCVEGGASVSFLLPMTRPKAQHYWGGVAESAARGERLVFVAEEPDGRIVGTTQVVWAQAENQPHRADVAKMLVHRRARRIGVGAAPSTAAGPCWCSIP